MRLGVGFCGLFVGLLSIPSIAASRSSGSVRYMEPYAVEGLGVGATVAPNSWQYKRYKCRPSEQYESAITCRFSEVKNGATNAITILHLTNNVVTYINKSVTPAFFTEAEIEREVQRLSDRFGAPPKVLPSRVGVIATWGDIKLLPLAVSDAETLRRGANPNQGFLVDYLMNFHESAREGLPIYRLSGGKGFVWVARFAERGKEGTLRFLAADPSKMIRSGLPEDSAPQRSAPGGGAPSSPTEPEKSTISTGTGFFVSNNGAVVTNAHVVEGCETTQIVSGLSVPVNAAVIARDSANDLALLKSDVKSSSYAGLRAGVRIGEEIAVFGYPLVGLLSTNGNFTLGNVSATAGTGDDTRFLQISAPVQKGNSGGPVLDKEGHVVGVVVSKLNVLKVAQEANDLAQNVNFAIKTTVLMNFLDANGVRYESGNSNSPLSSTDLAERAKSISVLIACETKAN